MENRKTILFLGSLFLAVIVVGMLYVDLIQKNIEGVENKKCPDGSEGPDCPNVTNPETPDIPDTTVTMPIKN